MTPAIEASPGLNRPLRIGLTGGIGSGKSTVARLFAERGVSVLDADQVARDLLQPGQPALAVLVERYGPGLLKEGHLDRSLLKQLIFTRPAERHWLDTLLHPLVYRQLEILMAATPDTPYHLLVIPLLIESGRRDFVDRLWVVDCAETLQRQRVAQRDGLDAALIERIMASQCSRTDRLTAADAVIDNTGSCETLYPQVERLHQALRHDIEITPVPV